VREINIYDLIRLDTKYAKEGIPPYQRPMKAAVDLLGSSFVLGGVANNNSMVKHITSAYETKFPNCAGWPGVGIGLVTSVDSVRKITVPVGYGTMSSDIYELLGFKTHGEHAMFANDVKKIAERHAYDFGDLYDFTYGLSDKGYSKPENHLWVMALHYLGVVSAQLESGIDNSGITQSISLVVELSVKAALIELGVDKKALTRKPYGHNLNELCKALAAKSPRLNDDQIISALIDKFPPFVESRYEPDGLRRLDRVRLATLAQFIAGSAMRRVSARDFENGLKSGEPLSRTLDLYQL